MKKIPSTCPWALLAVMAAGFSTPSCSAEVDFFRPMIDPTFKLAPLPTETCFGRHGDERATSAA